MKKIYIAAPLFNEMELKRNIEISNYLKSIGFEPYLPQDEAGLATDMINDNNKLEVNKTCLFSFTEENGNQE